MLTKKNNYLVYKLILPNGKYYIGLSSNFKCRLRAHLAASKTKDIRGGFSNNKPLYRAFRKYKIIDIKDINYEILSENLSKIEAEKLEIFYIKKLETRIFQNKGYNIAKGGEGAKYPATQETRNRMSLSRLGKSPWNKNKEYLQIRGEKHPLAIKLVDNETKKIFMSCREACLFYGIQPSNMTKHLNGLRKSVGGRTFSILHRKQPITYKRKNKQTHRARPIFCSELNRVFESQAQAARELGVKPQSIFRVLSGKRNRVKGYSFEYYDILVNKIGDKNE